MSTRTHGEIVEELRKWLPPSAHGLLDELVGAEPEPPSTQTEKRNAARALAIKASEQWIDQWESYEGSVVTGFLLISESLKLGSTHAITWLTGDGSEPREDGTSGLPAWRARGLMHEVLSELDGQEVEYQRRRMENE